MPSISPARPIAIAICLLLCLLDLGLGVETGYPGLLALTVAGAVLLYPYRYTSPGAVMLLTGASIYVVPYMSLLFIREPVNLSWLALFNIVCFAMLASTTRDHGMAEPARPRIETSVLVNLLAMVTILTLGLGVIALRPEDTTSGPFYLATWGLALLPLERLHWSASRFVHLAASGVFVLFILVYAVFVWTGEGRIVVLSLVLAPVLLTSLYRTFRVDGLLLAGAGMFMVFFGRVLRFGWSGGLAGVAEDSGATHILMSSQLWRETNEAFPITNFWEQYLLYFLNWIPRNAWPGKPLGVNYTFVDVYIGRKGLGEEFSTALGYFGEHIFYSRSFWLFMVVAVTLTTIYVRKAIGRLAGNYIGPVIIFDVWLITLFWGGMAVFASRIWFSIVPLLLVSWLIRSGPRNPQLVAEPA
jgi:hypothetical protein